MSDIILEAKDLKKYFKTGRGMLHAVDDVSFTIEKGKTLGVVGESGCGKSTLGRTVLKLLEPTDGQVIFNGHDITKYKKSQMTALRSKMQIIFQDPYSSLDPRRCVVELIAEPMLELGNMSKAEAFSKAESLMDTVGLAKRFAYVFPHELDGGRRQRIGVARALATDPDFIVCDEPVSALDVSIQAQILNLLMDLQDERGIAYMFVTHDLSVVKHISDQILVMYMGNCVEFAESDELFANPLHPYTKVLLAAILEPNLKHRGHLGEGVKGEVTSPIEPKPGCRFAPRCPYAKDICRQEAPPLYEAGPDHKVYCHLFAK
ncbi:MAG: ABC transporter ATP-binding protein [Firmicutes bacterium]|nr:ABC transporter ATP-binding protein [Bacillota bacterium]